MSDHPLSRFLPGFAVTQFDDHTTPLTITAIATAAAAPCPQCAVSSAAVHSYYWRTPRDLPIFEAAVHLRLRVRRFRCGNSGCATRTFSEPLPALLAPRAQRTLRCTERLRRIALALGGEAGARHATATGLGVSAATLLRITRAIVLPAYPTPRVLGVDDWALRKGRLYGTILVDHETHQPIDLIEGRTAEQFAAWLETHNPTAIEIITRDRSRDYANGSTLAAPQARQVADRWHLLRNMTDMLERILVRLRPTLQHRLTAAGDVHTGTAPAPLAITARDTRRARGDQQRQHDSRACRQALYAEIHALHAQGAKIIQIARHLQISRQTVRRYVRSSTCPLPALRAPQPSILDPYAAYLHGRWEAGCHGTKQLFKEIQAQGYRGSIRPLVQWTMLRRAQTEHHADPTLAESQPITALPNRLPPTRQVIWQLIQPTTTPTDENQRLLAELLIEPELATTYALVQRFRAMVQQRDAGAFDAWLADAQAAGVPEIVTFAEGLKREHASISAALELPYSNGPVEGQVTRLKQLRRAMYGRGSFDLVRKRFLAAA